MELEKAVYKVSERLKTAPSNMIITDDKLTVGEIKKTLLDVMNFIDYCKFEFGENITGGDTDESPRKKISNSTRK